MNAVDEYKQLIAAHSEPLTSEETIKLSRQIQLGINRLVETYGYKNTFARVNPEIIRNDLILAKAVKAKQKLHTHNLRFLFSQTRKYVRDANLLLDALQEASIGLSRACELFDPQKGYAFTTYAAWWIRQALLSFLAKKGSLKISTQILGNRRKIEKFKEQFKKENNRLPSDELIMSTLELNKKDFTLASNIPIEIELESIVDFDGDSDFMTWENVLQADKPTTFNDRLNHRRSILKSGIPSDKQDLAKKSQRILKKIFEGENLTPSDKKKINSLLTNG